jgi:HPt (histidine-containing phosphotransfer) domain-containing protein
MEDEDLMRELVLALLEDTTRQLGLLAEAVQNEDRPLCLRLSHYSKGACANVGANRAAAILKSLEREAADGLFLRCRESLAELTQELEVIRSQADALKGS